MKINFYKIVCLSLISGSFLSLHAWVDVKNTLWFPIIFEIKFETGWIGDSCGGEKFHQCASQVVPAGQTKRIIERSAGEALVKKRYIVKDTSGKILYNKPVNLAGHRSVDVFFYVRNSKTGDGEVQVKDALTT